MDSLLRHLDAAGLELRASKGRDGVVLRSHGQKIAYVFREHAASSGGHFRINGDFLAPGRHWTDLHEALTQLDDETQEAHTRRPERSGEPVSVLEVMPASVPGDAQTLALAASTRIRLDRTLAFGHRVVLKTDTYELSFAPIREVHGHLEVPFAFRRNRGKHVTAALRLRGHNDPLAIVFPSSADEATVIPAWIAALVAFADLTCVAAKAFVGPPAKPGGTQRWQYGARSPLPRARGRSPAVPRRSQRRFATLSENLSPIGRTARYAASYVAGHRRYLASGRRSSEDARAAARAVGLTLHDGETWVRPHARGLPHGASLEFRWTAPAAIASF